ncbi:MAG TPA: GtrA family protein [Chromatiaceae bacterium]|nr:GtrA family protein [Chromatiaceae bacterium]
MPARRILRFSISGLVVTGLHVLIASSLIQFLSITPSFANGAAYILATTFSYVINTKWSFSSPLHGKNLARFYSVSVTGLLLTMSISGAAQHLGLNHWYGIALVVCIIPPVTFLLHHRWTYN